MRYLTQTQEDTPTLWLKHSSCTTAHALRILNHSWNITKLVCNTLIVPLASCPADCLLLQSNISPQGYKVQWIWSECPHQHQSTAATSYSSCKSSRMKHWLQVMSICNCVDKSFPVNSWDLLIPQAEHILNVLCPSKMNLVVSAYTMLHRHHDFAANPMAPAGCRVIVHEHPKEMSSWGNQGTEVFFTNQTQNHYHSFVCWGVLSPGDAQLAHSDIWSVCGSIHNTEYRVFRYFWTPVCSLLFLFDTDFLENVKTYSTSKLNILVLYVFTFLRKSVCSENKNEQTGAFLSVRWNPVKFCCAQELHGITRDFDT